jgi:hypothetical protein
MSFHARLQPAFLFLMLVLATLPIAIGMLLFTQGSGFAKGSAVFVAAIGSYLWIATLRLRGSQRSTLVLDDAGLEHAWRGGVDWKDVQGVSLEWEFSRWGDVPILALRLAPGVMPRHRSRWFNPPGLPRLVVFSLRGLDRSPEEILAAALRLRDRVDSGRVDGWHSEMNDEAYEALARQQQLLARAGRGAPADRNKIALDAAREHRKSLRYLGTGLILAIFLVLTLIQLWQRF